jgi:hypothetical protein
MDAPVLLIETKGDALTQLASDQQNPVAHASPCDVAAHSCHVQRARIDLEHLLHGTALQKRFQQWHRRDPFFDQAAEASKRASCA